MLACAHCGTIDDCLGFVGVVLCSWYIGHADLLLLDYPVTPLQASNTSLGGREEKPGGDIKKMLAL